MDFSLIRLRSVALPRLFLRYHTGAAGEAVERKGVAKCFSKGPYSVTECTFRVSSGELSSVYSCGDGMQPLSLSLEKSGEYYRVVISRAAARYYLDVYDGASSAVYYWEKNDNENQLFSLESGSPPIPSITKIMDRWSPITKIRMAQLSDFIGDFRIRQDSVRVFHQKSLPFKPSAALLHIPLVCINGDRFILLSNLHRLLGPAEDERLINYRERRLARKMVVASRSKVFAKGGLGEAQPALLEKPFEAVILSIAGAQFELRELEFQDFIVLKDAPATRTEREEAPLFPHYYQGGKKPAFAELAASSQRYVDVDRGRYLLLDAYQVSVREDWFLVLTAFSKMIPPGRRGRLRVVGFGLGFFANLDMNTPLTDILLPEFVAALEWNLLHHDFPGLEILEFGSKSAEMTDGAKSKDNLVPKGVVSGKIGRYRIVDSSPGLLEPPESDEIVGLMNPSDVDAFKGNEEGYDSVEALLGNNTDLRYNQVALFNPSLLNPQNWIAV